MPTHAHERIVWLSLDCLTPVWKDYPVILGSLAQVREAARIALDPCLRGKTQEPADVRFTDALSVLLSAEKARTISNFMMGLQRLQTCDQVGPWRAFFGQYQHRLDVDGLRLDVATLLATHFREDVVTTRRTRERRLRQAVTDIPLSDWDRAVHAFYGLGEYHVGQFDKNIVLVGLSALTDAIVFNDFLEKRVMALGPAEQDALLVAVRKSWIEIALADPIAALKGTVIDGEAEAMRIPPAKNTIVSL
jgi:hypothetical protein